jgi:hypothetical protein
MENTNSTPANQKKCFVVMGFGIKTDYATGRKLDLDKSYRLLIKPVVEDKQLSCIRADEIRHSGSIEVPMYEELLQADVVIADLSTANLNAFYELGVRHALRPRTTIVVSEDKLPYPFDLNHIKITKYTHLGDAIDYDEVERFRNELGKTLEAVLNDEQPDSPVYTFLKLIPPSLQEQAAQAAEQMENVLDAAKTSNKAAEAPKEETAQENQTLSLLIEQGEKALKEKDFSKAKTLFNSALIIGKNEKEVSLVTHNSYIIQRLALATYKAEEPDAVSALKQAITILNQLDLNTTNDPETVALAGAIEKRLYERGQGEDHLYAAVIYYTRGYFLRSDRYNAINLAFMINCRVDSSLDDEKEEKIADLVNASRIRMDVLNICDKEWNEMMSRENRAAAKAGVLNKDDLSLDQVISDNEQKFWVLVNKAEAHFGLGEFDDYEKARADALQVPHADWMLQTFDHQVTKLGEILEKYGDLMNPKWIKKPTAPTNL